MQLILKSSETPVDVTLAMETLSENILGEKIDKIEEIQAIKVPEKILYGQNENGEINDEMETIDKAKESEFISTIPNGNGHKEHNNSTEAFEDENDLLNEELHETSNSMSTDETEIDKEDANVVSQDPDKSQLFKLGDKPTIQNEGQKIDFENNGSTEVEPDPTKDKQVEENTLNYLESQETEQKLTKNLDCDSKEDSKNNEEIELGSNVSERNINGFDILDNNEENENDCDEPEDDLIKFDTEIISKHNNDVDETICDDIKSTAIDDIKDSNSISELNSAVDTVIEKLPEDSEIISKTCEDHSLKILNESDEVLFMDADLKKQESINELKDIDESEDIKEKQSNVSITVLQDAPKPEESKEKEIEPTFKLSNMLDIFSDDEEDKKNTEDKSNDLPSCDEKSANVEDDDDIMLIDEDLKKEGKTELEQSTESNINQEETKCIELDNVCSNDIKAAEDVNAPMDPTGTIEGSSKVIFESDKMEMEKTKVQNGLSDEEKPLVPRNFLESCKINLADMTRENLEEFCIQKIVESVFDRSSLNEIKSKLKTLMHSFDEYKKKAMMLTKQNRDLQVVLKSVQEEQKKLKSSGQVIVPLKITRSVGMQVLMTEKPVIRRKLGVPPANNTNKTETKSSGTPNRNFKPTTANPPQIPVPRLVPASNISTTKQNVPSQAVLPPNIGKISSAPKNTSPVNKPEKRPLGKTQSLTVDLTDDEPPPKLLARNANPPVRLVPSQNLMPTQRLPFPQSNGSPRKVFIPITGTQAPVRSVMLHPVLSNVRPRGPAQQMIRTPGNGNRIRQRHPAPLPEPAKQYQNNAWKALPPAPDLKLSKVENGIVISWKIDGYQEDSYEEITSYQLYAYQETSAQPSTALWKKIGDVRALPLPMACTLTQFMAGYKYYFAVRAVDAKSRLGPFSLPGSILLLNKM